MQPPRKVISVVVPSRTHVPPDEPLTGTLGMSLVEELRRNCYAFAGVDAQMPMRRDLVRVVRIVDAEEEDF